MGENYQAMISRWEGRERGATGTAGEMEKIKQRWERGGDEKTEEWRPASMWKKKKKIKAENCRAWMWRNKERRGADADRGEDDKVLMLAG